MSTHASFAIATCPFRPRSSWHKRACKRRLRPNSGATACAQHASVAPAYPVEVALWDGLTARGAAFCVTPGEFVTCFHVLAHTSAIFVDGHRARLLRVCRAADVAVLSCAPLADTALPLQLCSGGTPGEIVGAAPSSRDTPGDGVAQPVVRIWGETARPRDDRPRRRP